MDPTEAAQGLGTNTTNRPRIICPIGCKQVILVEFLQNHLRFVCAHRHVDCELCGKSIVYNLNQDHAAECPRLMLKCPNDCAEGQTFAREELPEHLKVCKMSVSPCKYEHIGCEYKGSGKDRIKHENNLFKHFKNMADALVLFNLQFDVLSQNMKGDVLLLKNENLAFREGLKEVLTQFERIRDTNNKLMQKVTSLQANIDKRKTVAHNAEIDAEKNALANDNNSTVTAYKTEVPRNWELIEIIEQLKTRLDSQDAIINKLVASANCNGTYLWKIKGYARYKLESIAGRQKFITSEPFFTYHYGYRLSAKAYLGGKGDGFRSHLSLFISIVQGPWDDVLAWPFQGRIRFRLLDQRNVLAHLKDDIEKTTMENQSGLMRFQKTRNAPNVDSGIAKFVAHRVIEESGKYLVNDTIYVEILVDYTSK